MNNTSISLYEFAWTTLTSQQQFRINVKYELVKRLQERKSNVKKRDVYRAVASEYGYTMKRIEDIANELK